MDSGTQTDAVVVLFLAQAAVLGLVSENELFGATISAGAFYPDLGPGAVWAAIGEPRPRAPTSYQLACNGWAPGGAGAERRCWRWRRLREKHTRRKTAGHLCALVPKVKFEKVEEEEEVYEVRARGDDKDAGPAEAPAEAASGGCEASWCRAAGSR